VSNPAPATNLLQGEKLITAEGQDKRRCGQEGMGLRLDGQRHLWECSTQHSWRPSPITRSYGGAETRHSPLLLGRPVGYLEGDAEHELVDAKALSARNAAGHQVGYEIRPVRQTHAATCSTSAADRARWMSCQRVSLLRRSVQRWRSSSTRVTMQACSAWHCRLSPRIDKWAGLG
jgi:hypothetical protein